MAKPKKIKDAVRPSVVLSQAQADRVQHMARHREVYTVCFEEVIYVLHIFQKKSKKGIATPKEDMELIKQRLKWAEALHKEQYGKKTP